MTTARQALSTTRRPTTAAASRRAGQIIHAGSAAMLVGGLLVAFGSVLPWVSTPAGSLSGTAGAGLWTLCAGVVAIAGALIPHRRVALVHAALPGLAVAAIVAWQLARLMQLSATTDSWGKLLPGIGLVLAGGGAVILLRIAARLRHST
ncbi:hypothetical protein [Phytoactinopolyspora endophytica]|uniref:hypothetical protein n=1 Tax=Phytoactinopolyspora endophytica TaxID=1642495 RepID=UPI00197C0830|nr:hypothetical protein [Phytoactinopolyspora endophytica]